VKARCSLRVIINLCPIGDKYDQVKLAYRGTIMLFSIQLRRMVEPSMTVTMVNVGKVRVTVLQYLVMMPV